MLLSIIIVNYNGTQYLRDCLNSIKQMINCEYEVIIVDNASSDGSTQYLKNNFPWVKLIENNCNSGFSAGNNLGVSIARGDYILLLNNDTLILDDIQPAMEVFENNDDIGVIGCKLLYGDGRLQFSNGYDHTPLRITLSWIGLQKFNFLPSIFRREERRTSHYDKIQHNVSWVSGAFLITRKHLWKKLGGMDDHYFMYVEDVDYCKRVRDAGYRVVYLPSIKIIHYEGGGKVWLGRNALHNTVNSYLKYVHKHHNKIAVFFMRYVLCGIMLLRGIVYGAIFMVINKDVYKEKCKAFSGVGASILKEKLS